MERTSQYLSKRLLLERQEINGAVVYDLIDVTNCNHIKVSFTEEEYEVLIAAIESDFAFQPRRERYEKYTIADDDDIPF